jgi:hypothetical protein
MLAFVALKFAFAVVVEFEFAGGLAQPDKTTSIITGASVINNLYVLLDRVSSVIGSPSNFGLRNADCAVNTHARLNPQSAIRIRGARKRIIRH